MTYPSFAVDGDEVPVLGIDNYVGVKSRTLYIWEGSKTSTINVVF